MDVFTICAVNYLPFAHNLGISFLKFNPGSSFSILVIDGSKVSYAKNPKFDYFEPNQLKMKKNEFENMALYYNVTELATALKPSAAKLLFEKGAKKVVYLDPDIEVFEELTELNEALDTHTIVLTPHTLNPIPRDGLRPTEAEILGSGTFNLGFLGLSDSIRTKSFLNWWEERLKFDSISDPSEMLFTDQRWIDFVPSYFDFSTLRHPGYNVAYWNLQERKLSIKNGKYLVNDLPLKFFHFSGYEPDKPWLLSKYVKDNPRVVISEDKVLLALCENYGKQIRNNGWDTGLVKRYGFQNFENGKFIPYSLRRLYRDECIKTDRNGSTLLPPANWNNWATEKSLESGNLSRILFALWKSRPDLINRFPDATGNQSQEFISWAKSHGIQEKVIHEDFLEVGNLENITLPTRTVNSLGVNLSGYLSAELGVGQSARLIYRTLKESGLPISVLNSNRVASRKMESLDLQESENLYPITLAVINADHFKLWVRDMGPKIINETYIIGIWAWELEEFPSRMREAFEYVDEVWTVSEFAKRSIQRFTNKSVHVFPHPVIQPVVNEKFDRVKHGIIDKEFNLFIFDYLSVFNRKNPIGVVDAHKMAFPKEDGPILVIKSINGDKDAVNREKLRYQIKDRSDIFLIEDYLSRNQILALINECEVYISLHRSEGYGLTMAEAMSLKKPVIATGYSGNLDFMNEENSVLIPFTRTKVGEGSPPYDENLSWANPDLRIAAEKILNLHMDKDLAKKIASKGYEQITLKYDLKKSAEFIKNTFTIKSQIKILIKIRIKKLKYKSFKFYTRFLSAYKHYFRVFK